MIRKSKSYLLLLILFLTNSIISIPKVSAPPPPPPLLDQFIGELLSNRTLSLNLINSNVLITINSTNYPEKIGLNFDADYTIFNPENNTNIKLGLPFSLGFDVIKSNFQVRLNKTQIDFNLCNFTTETVNETKFDLDFISRFYIPNPITLIQSNFTILENATYSIGYKFSGVMNNPINSIRDTLSLFYYLNTSKVWNGNTTGRVEFRIYGTIPTFAMTYHSYYPEVQIIEIIGGKSASWEWNNRKMKMLAVGICYDERSYSPFDMWFYINIAFYVLIGVTIIIIISKRKSKRNLQE